jgi:ABC-type multidrug transport system fused ATPase/permease subunit
MTAVAATTMAYALLAGPLIGSLYRGADATWMPQVPGDPAVVLAATLLAVTVARAVAGYGHRVLSARIGQDVVRVLRERMYTHLLRAVPRSLVAQRRGEIASRLSSDALQVQTLVSSNLTAIASDVITLVGLVVVAFGLDMVLACIALAALPPIAVITWWIASRVRRAHRRVWEQHAELSSAASDLVDTLPIIRAYGAEAKATESFVENARELERRSVSAQRWSAIGGPVVQLLGAIALVSALMLSAHRMSVGDLAVDTFVSFFAAMFFVYRPVQGLGATAQRIASGLAALDRVEEVLGAPTEHDPASAITIDRMREKLELAGVRFSYREDEPVLDGVDLTIDAGESIAIVGASGEGKTTLLRAMLGLLDPDEGAVRIDGVEAARVTRASWRKQFAWVTQEPLIFTDTVLANVALADETPDRDRAREALRAAGASELDLDRALAEGGKSLSGGQRQRVCIARALYRDSPILVFDEATSSLDGPSERAIAETIEELMGDRTVVVVSHRYSTVRRADRAVVLEAGRIAESGAPDRLMERGGRFHALFRDAAL